MIKYVTISQEMVNTTMVTSKKPKMKFHRFSRL